MEGIRHDAWFSGVFGRDVFRVEAPAPESCDPAAARAAVARHAAGRAAAFYYAKVDAARPDALRALASAGFFTVDVNVSFLADPARLPAVEAPAGLEIGAAAPADRDEVLRIAATAFRYSRFHLDPLVPDETANRIKRDWTASYLDGRRGERLWVGRVGGRPAAFLAVLALERDGRSVRRIDLVAVDRAAQGRGIGRALTAFFVERYRGSCDRLEVGTQIANAPSIRLYERLGFELFASEYVLHMHVRDGKPL